jgi:hypothetical protein
MTLAWFGLTAFIDSALTVHNVPTLVNLGPGLVSDSFCNVCLETSFSFKGNQSVRDLGHIARSKTHKLTLYKNSFLFVG